MELTRVRSSHELVLNTIVDYVATGQLLDELPGNDVVALQFASSDIDHLVVFDAEGNVWLSLRGNDDASHGASPLNRLATGGGSMLREFTTLEQYEDGLWETSVVETVHGVGSAITVAATTEVSDLIQAMQIAHEDEVAIIGTGAAPFAFSAETGAMTVPDSLLVQSVGDGFMTVQNASGDYKLTYSNWLEFDQSNRPIYVRYLMSYFNSPIGVGRVLTVILAGAFLLLALSSANAVARRTYRPIAAVVRAAHNVLDIVDETALRSPTPDDLLDLTRQLDTLSAAPHRQKGAEALLERYVGSAVAGNLLSNDPKLQDVHFVDATVFFADIRDFTALSAGTDLSHLHRELNEYYSIVIDIIHRQGGEVNKFGGDSILALFGAPTLLEGHAQAAVLAAMNIMVELEAFNARRRLEERPAYSVGIGINTGRMLIGSFGSEHRLEYTVIGDCVNTAHRLSDLSKETPFYSVFIGEQTKRNVGDVPNWEIHSLGKKLLRGRAEPTDTYTLFQVSDKPQ